MSSRMRRIVATAAGVLLLVLGACSEVTRAPTPAEPEIATAAKLTLGGIVWEDLDRDGLMEIDEPPMPGVTVELLDASAAPFDPAVLTVTGDDGAYLFAELAADTYYVAFSRPEGYEFSRPDRGDSDANLLTGVAGPIVLGRAEIATQAVPTGPTPGEPSAGLNIAPILVSGNPSCKDLNADETTFPWITSDFGFKVEDDYNRTVPMDASAASTFLTSAAPADSSNTVTLASEDGVYVDWTATLGIDAVIVKASPAADVFVYTPEAFFDSGLHAPINPNTSEPYDISHIEFCYDYELTATKTADAEYTRTYTWEITKTVDPDTHTGWFGDEFTSSYDVIVDQTVVDSSFAVRGTITIANPTPFTVGFSVSDLVGTTVAAIDCDPVLEGNQVSGTLAPGASATCAYVADFGDTRPADGTNTATVASTNANVLGATAEAAYAFGDPTTVVGYPTINVTDYFDCTTVDDIEVCTETDDLGSASGDFTFDYDRDFACPTDKAEYMDGVYTASFPNTAQIDETDQSENASVDLTCYMPVAAKDANTEWFREYTWEITKTVAPASHVGFPGDEFTSDYDVFVDQTIRDYGYRAFGSISVTNPSPDEAITVTVADAVNGTTATVDCDGAGGTSLLVAAGATESCDYTVDLTGTTQLLNTATVTYGDHDFTATADVIFGDPKIVGYPTINVIDYFDGDTTGKELGSASADKTFEYDRDFACPADEAAYTSGVHTDAFPNTAEIDETEQSDDANVDLTCYLPATAKVVKTTIEGDEDIGQFPFTFKLYDPDGNLVETKTLGTGGGTVPFATDLEAEGTWTVTETLPTGWVSTTDLTCDVVVAYPGSANQTYTCTFDNVEMSRVDLLKLTNGLETTAQTWTFKVYEGPDGFGGTELASDNTPPALLDFGNVNLDPYETYTLCELEVPAGYSSFWQLDINGDGVGDTTVVPYNPNADDDPPEDLGNRCVDFGYGTTIPLVPGETLHFVVDNRMPGGDPRTPGYWKNWNTCTGGGQQYTAAANGGWEEGFWLLEDVLDPTIGGGIVWDDILTDGILFPIDACEIAVDILDKRLVGDPTIVADDRKVASDPLHNLATHLLAAQLNFGAGACTTQEVLDVALEAEALLDAYDFGPTGHVDLKKKDANAQLANELADYLDRYNNGEFCSGTTY